MLEEKCEFLNIFINKFIFLKSFERTTLKQIKNHEFFKGVIWEDYLQKKYKAPITNIKTKLLMENSKKTDINENTVLIKNLHFKQQMNS